MSMDYWNVTGYGINEEELCPSTDKQIAFIKKYLPAEYEEKIWRLSSARRVNVKHAEKDRETCDG